MPKRPLYFMLSLALVPPAFKLMARPILSTLLILLVTACTSAPREAVVFSGVLMPSAMEAPRVTATMPAVSPVAVSAVASLEIPKPEKARQPAPAAFVTTTQRKAAQLVRKPDSASITTPSAPAITRSGSAAYYIPKQMREKEASLVDLWIDRTTSIEKLKQELAAKLQITADKINMRNVKHTDKQSGTAVVAQIDGVTIPIGGAMVAQLRGGDDFAIEPKEPVQQPLQNEDRAKWNWRVTPKHASETGMLLDLDIWIDPGQGKHLIESYHESVIVEAIPVPWYEKLYKIMQEMNAWLTLLGIGGVSGLLTWLWKQKDSKPLVALR